MITVRYMISLAASRKWNIHQLDVSNAFLYGDLYEEVYVIPPKGYPNPFNKVCRLRKSLYGLKQASRQWFAKLATKLVDEGFQQSKYDYNLFIHKHGTNITIMGVYVNDIIITGSTPIHIKHINDNLCKVFSIKDLGILQYFMGIKISNVCYGIVLS